MEYTERRTDEASLKVEKPLEVYINSEKIRESFSSMLESDLREAFKTIGGYNTFSESKERRKAFTLKLYSIVKKVFATIKELMDTYPNKLDEILGGEFYVSQGKFPLYIFLDMLLAVCQSSGMTISDNDFPYYLQIIDMARTLPVLPEFANLHIDSSFIKLLGADTPFHFDNHCDKRSVYNNTTGEWKEYISTVGTYNDLHYGSTNVNSIEKSNNLLNSINCLRDDIVTYPELVCKPIHTIEIRNTHYKWGLEEKNNRYECESRQDVIPNIWCTRRTISTYLTYAIFLEEQAELTRRYEKVREYVNQVKLARWQKDFEDGVLPLFRDQTFDSFDVVSLSWESSEDGRKCYEHLESFYETIHFYKINKGISLEQILNSLEFFEMMQRQINGILLYMNRIKENLIMKLLNIFVTISEVAKQSYRTGNMSQEELSSKLERMSIADLYSCIVSAQEKKFGQREFINVFKPKKD